MNINLQPQTFSQILEDHERLLHDLDPRHINPPYLTTVFDKKRKDAFSAFQNEEKTGSEPLQNNRMFFFFLKYEVEFVEILRSKLRERYIDYILQKKADIPRDIDMQEIEGFGAVSEIAQLAIAIAEWNLEVEIVAYLIEGLKLYGLWTPEESIEKHEKEEEDYFQLIKKEYNYEGRGLIACTFLKMFRKALNFSLDKISSIAMSKGLAQGGIQNIDFLQLAISLASATVVPWKSLIGSMNVTWVVGAYCCSYFMKRVSDYAVRGEALSKMKEVQESFEANKLLLMTERRTVMEILQKMLNEKDEEKYKFDAEVLGRAVKNILEAPKKTKDGKTASETDFELHQLYTVKEVGDCVVVEENWGNEKMDESGVVVVDL